MDVNLKGNLFTKQAGRESRRNAKVLCGQRKNAGNTTKDKMKVRKERDKLKSLHIVNCERKKQTGANNQNLCEQGGAGGCWEV